MMKAFSNFQFLWHLLIIGFIFRSQADNVARYTFVVKESTHTRLCNSKNILTVNGQFPGPTIYAKRGETVIVDVHNQGTQNITIHWHGVKQPRNPWSDGPEYVTQCPIQPGGKFSQKIVLSDEEGTLWWHAHSDWSRATVHGALVVYPKDETSYPFGKPHAEVPIILGEWWKEDVQEVLEDFMRRGADPANSDALTINGQPGDLYPCSKPGIFKLNVDTGKTYMLRMINAAMNNIAFFAIANHKLTVVGTDGAYTKPLKSDYISISPGQTLDVLLEANQPLNQYYMASKFLSNSPRAAFDNTTTTAILSYNRNPVSNLTTPSLLPKLPASNDTISATNFTFSLRSLASKEHPVNVPLRVSKNLFFTLSINIQPCDQNNTCELPGGNRLAASLNNISFVLPKTSILEAYNGRRNSVYGDRFPNKPQLRYNYTADVIPNEFLVPRMGAEVKVLKYNTEVELVFQGTSLLAGIDHPIHLHGYSFYVVGRGFGNFDKKKDPLNYNLVDPPLQQTIHVPRNGWTAIRFVANNPGVWFMHCHIERHMSWGMKMVFIVRDGKQADAKMLPPPSDMPQC